jgi:hypothetical protein
MFDHKGNGRTKKWFETLGYKFETYKVLEKDYSEWIINIPKRRGYDRKTL